GGSVATTADRASTSPILNPVNITADSSITTSSGAASVGFPFGGSFSGTSGKTVTLTGNTTAGQAFNPRLTSAFTYIGKIAIVNNGGATTLELFNSDGNDQIFR